MQKGRSRLYESGLLDNEGFSHLYVLWVFDRAGVLPETWVGTPLADDRPHGVFAVDNLLSLPDCPGS